jgi:hypothetical protein
MMNYSTKCWKKTEQKYEKLLKLDRDKYIRRLQIIESAIEKAETKKQIKTGKWIKQTKNI